jgi:phosphonate transport system ATP-binding protein
MTSAIRITGLSKTFDDGHRALIDIQLSVAAGEMVAVIGASGSGKSTMLRHIAGLVTADRGTGRIEIHGRTVQCNGKLASDVRDVRAGVGFVFQQFNLVGRLPVIMNVLSGRLHRTPLWRSLLKWFRRDELAAALLALDRVGILAQANQRASTLSGGQQQRAAIARTLVQGARIVLADEPIASLDPESSRRVMEILAAINREDRCTVIVSLHQVNVALRYCPRTVALRHGRVVYDGASSALTPALLRELYGAEAEEILNLPDHIGALEDRPGSERVHVAPRPAYA